VVRAAIARSVLRFVRYEAGARLGDDEEGVHKSRVATRRLRSDLKTFRPLLDRDWAQDLRGELKWLADKLGDVRDAEVMHARFEEEIAALDPRDREAGEWLIHRLLDQRRRVRRRLLEALREPRYTQLLDRLVDAVHAPPLRAGADAPADDALPRLAAKQWKRLRKRVRRLDDPPSAGGLHEVRKRAKQARYAAEAVTPAVGPPAKKFAKRVSDLQDVLGDHQDACVAEAWLREAADGAGDRRTFVAGALVTGERERSAETRAAWTAVWATAAKRKRRRWM
jgi:CHAD domain-containing protein